MVVNQKNTGRALSMPKGLAWGAATSLAITIAGTAFVSRLIHSETIEESAIGYAVMGMLLLGAYLGALVAINKIKRQRLAVCMISGGIYLVMLLGITALFFGGQYEAVGVTACLIFGGSFLAVLSEKRPGRRGKGRRIRIPNC